MNFLRASGGIVSKTVLVESGESYSDKCASGNRATPIHVTRRLGVSSVRPKLGFGIENRNQGPIWVSVSEPDFFFSNFSHFFFTSFGNTSFYKLENKPRSSKII